MSRTLFWYIFGDLVKIFLLTAVALAAVMSFGGLLQPLVKHGVDLSQTLQILYYILPAMSTYSLPIAALFATTLVYGRLAADNEITAVRASGISYLAAAVPAAVLGLVVSILSLLLLCYIVPVSTMQVERVIYSNIARHIANSIDKQSSIRIPDGPTVMAEEARVLPIDPALPRRQAVELVRPTIVVGKVVEVPDAPTEKLKKMRVPEQFYLAESATIFIQPTLLGDEMEISARFVGGASFPREFADSTQGGVASTTYGPQIIPSPLRENTRFMDLPKLRAILAEPGRAQRVAKNLADVNRMAQKEQLVGRIIELLDTPARRAVLHTTAGEQFVIVLRTAVPRLVKGQLELAPPQPLTEPFAEGEGPLLITRLTNGVETLRIEAAAASISFEPDRQQPMFSAQLVAEDAITSTVTDVAAPRSRFRMYFSVPMDERLAAVARRTTTSFASDEEIPGQLQRALTVTRNEVKSELNSRASFAVSCIVLVMVGCALGMMFRSGDFVSAFGVSVIPAVLCIILNVAGRHTAENVPSIIPPDWTNPLTIGLVLMWTGNTIVAVVGVIMLTRLQRT